METPVGGTCDPAFEAVREAFTANFPDPETNAGSPDEVPHGSELGAALTVVAGGLTVVDLWGGWRDEARTQPWTADTLVNAFSVGKALTATCVLQLVGHRRLDLDTPVVEVWPQFTGKDDVTVRTLLCHQAGLPAIGRPMPPMASLDWELMTRSLAEQEPWWPPGSAHGYHVNTFGYLLGEVLRRVDGRSLGTYLHDEVAGPLDADLFVGLPDSERHRTADFALWPMEGVDAIPSLDEVPDGERMTHAAYMNPPDLSGVGVVNDPAWRRAEIPSTNPQASARGVARVFEALLAARTRRAGKHVVDPGALEEATAVHSDGTDRVVGSRTVFGLGFQLPREDRPIGPSASAFGHYGAGGALGAADPEADVAIGYVMNRAHDPNWSNRRNRALIEAIRASL